jgi:hypothetical protein
MGRDRVSPVPACRSLRSEFQNRFTPILDSGYIFQPIPPITPFPYNDLVWVIAIDKAGKVKRIS